MLGLVAAPATAAAAPCVPDTATACIQGTLRTSAGDPAVGVALAVEGPAGSFEAVTNDAGQWSVAVTESGEYTVTLDEATLPAGETLRDPASNPKTVQADLGKRPGALFALGDPGGAPAPTTPPAGGDGETSAPTATTAPDAESGAAGESAAAGSGNNRVLQLILSGLVFGLLLALASVGANLIYGTTGLSNFAHGDLVTLGGLVAFSAVRWWGLPLWSSIILATIAGCIIGWLLDAGIFAPLRRRGVGITQQLIVTIGLALAMLNLYLVLYGASPLPIVSSISERIQLGPVSMSQQTMLSVVIAGVVLAAVALVLQRTRIGRATRAVSDNPALAAASGIKVASIIRGVWVASSGLASLGGVLMGLYLGSTRFNFGSVLLLLMFAAITLGGLGSPLGGLLGALVIGLVVELSTLILPSDLRYASALVILIVVLLVRPQGILGRAQRIG
ncbi:branched-chain amino acid ABC transporter permease [Serinibacter arcticus]|uniref:branched-chain amino acid ABC transporter permease n=1 Tax=Serinibacter arcticus TaxID=1655435 RepID=UPI001F23BB36|nr:branched-chain amino acid ABC transporter permease [Serinibacter arcticus]